MKPKSQKRHTRPGDPIKWGKFLDVRGKLITHIEEGLSYSVCCDLCGVGRTTFYSYLEKGEKEPSSPYGAFVRAVAAANARACRELHVAVKRVDPKWLLERRFPEDYPSPKHLTELSGSLETRGELRHRITISCSDEPRLMDLLKNIPMVDAHGQPITGPEREDILNGRNGNAGSNGSRP